MNKTVLRRKRLDWNLVKLNVYWNGIYIGCIRRQKIKGVAVYILLDRRDWFVGCYDNLKSSWTRACDWGFRGGQLG